MLLLVAVWNEMSIFAAKVHYFYELLSHSTKVFNVYGFMLIYIQYTMRMEILNVFLYMCFITCSSY